MPKKKNILLTKELIGEAIVESFKKLAPQIQFRNPVMFVTYLSALFITFLTIRQFNSFNLQLTLWLWFTVLFANFAGAIAECRGKAQAAFLKKSQMDTSTIKIVNEKEIQVSITSLQKGDLIVCQEGDLIPVDGEITEGVATVDESAITGESAPVIRESGGDRSAVTAGTRIISDRIVIRVSSEKGHSFFDRMIGLIEGTHRQKTPTEVALNIVLSALTIVFLLSVISLRSFAAFSSQAANQDLSSIVTLPVLTALLVCLIPTTISALLDAIGISGMDRLIQCNVIAKNGRAVEAAGDIDLLILDKTGTITLGNRMATSFIPIGLINEKEFAEVAQLASLSDETPEGRSIVILAKQKFNLRAKNFETNKTAIIPFSTQTQMSGINFLNEQGHVIRIIRKGSVKAIKKHVERLGGTFEPELLKLIDPIAHQGGTPLLVSDGSKIVGIIHLKDIIKGGIKERFIEMRKLGIKTLMITGDNALTAAAIAAEAGVDDFVAHATPEMKLARIREEQLKGRLIAMTGDGTNDAPALAQADVGVAMNTGTQASREAGNMVDLDSNPTKLLNIVKIGKQLLMTRGSLTTFSIANDVAKYLAIIPALFGSLYALPGEQGPIAMLNVMRLHSPQTALLSAVMFNALIIMALIPLALKGVPYKSRPASQILRHNLLVYGLGGLVIPFIGIKIIDMIITATKLI